MWRYGHARLRPLLAGRSAVKHRLLGSHVVPVVSLPALHPTQRPEIVLPIAESEWGDPVAQPLKPPHELQCSVGQGTDVGPPVTEASRDSALTRI